MLDILQNLYARLLFLQGLFFNDTDIKLEVNNDLRETRLDLTDLNEAVHSLQQLLSHLTFWSTSS